MQLHKFHWKAVLCTDSHFSNAFDLISKKQTNKQTTQKNRLIHFFLGAGLTLHAFLLPAHSYMQHTRSHLLCVDSLHPTCSGTSGEEWQCGGPCEEEPLRSYQGMQDSSGTRNLPTHLPVHSWSTQEASLEINLMSGEITTLLQMRVEISSSVHLGHSTILLCLEALKIWI